MEGSLTTCGRHSRATFPGNTSGGVPWIVRGAMIARDKATIVRATSEPESDPTPPHKCTCIPFETYHHVNVRCSIAEHDPWTWAFEITRRERYSAPSRCSVNGAGSTAPTPTGPVRACGERRGAGWAGGGVQEYERSIGGKSARKLYHLSTDKYFMRSNPVASSAPGIRCPSLFPPPVPELYVWAWQKNDPRWFERLAGNGDERAERFSSLNWEIYTRLEVTVIVGSSDLAARSPSSRSPFSKQFTDQEHCASLFVSFLASLRK